MSDFNRGPHTKSADYLMAAALSAGSAVMSVLPEQLNFIGKDSSPSYTAVRWRRVGRPAEAIDGAWVTYEGIKDSGLTPANYGEAAIILVDREEMDRHQMPGGGQHAVVYRLGSAAMMGSSSKHDIFGLENEDDQDYKFAMRLGKGPLIAGAGLHKFARGGVIINTAFIYDPLKKGIRKGPTMPIADIPSSVPLL